MAKTGEGGSADMGRRHGVEIVGGKGAWIHDGETVEERKVNRGGNGRRGVRLLEGILLSKSVTEEGAWGGGGRRSGGTDDCCGCLW